MWQKEWGRCIEKSESVPCAKNFVVGTCKEAGCIWNDFLNACHSKHDNVPCVDLYEKSWCLDRADCKFSQESMQCHGKDEVLECEHYQTEVQCKSVPKCKFYRFKNIDFTGGDRIGGTLSGQCHDKSKSTCGFISDEQECHPNITPGCAYDHHANLCRTLRAPRDEF